MISIGVIDALVALFFEQVGYSMTSEEAYNQGFNSGRENSLKAVYDSTSACDVDLNHIVTLTVE
jgi:hypothetical protein